MIILGVALIVVGWIFGIWIVTAVGVVLLAIGAILTILGATGNGVGGRRTYY
jgi:hypothetical protein